VRWDDAGGGSGDNWGCSQITANKYTNIQFFACLNALPVAQPTMSKACFSPTVMPVDIPFGALTLLVGRLEGHPACKNVGYGLLVMMIWLSCASLSLPPPSTVAPTKFRMEIFWYRLTQLQLEKWPLKWREKESRVSDNRRRAVEEDWEVHTCLTSIIYVQAHVHLPAYLYTSIAHTCQVNR